ncbi:hypothetical protein SLS56_002922 [Neofusicoccum ribis]|uniref:Cytochrome P450 n=1 Tax=Neofusicoccum ribis TaxID=45134 RepID=A0ABR3T144_9PEZI
MMDHMIQSRYSLPAIPKGEIFHASTIKLDINRHLAALTGDIAEEVRAGLEEVWGTNTEEWKSFRVLDTVRQMSIRTSVRIFFGKELSQDKAFLRHADRWSLFLTTGSGLLGIFVPRILKPVLGPVLLLPARYHAWRMNKTLFPLIDDRIAQLSSPSSRRPPNDILHHHVATALASAEPADRSPALIAARLSLILGFAAIPTTYLALTNTLLNLASSDPATPSLLRHEAAAIRSRNNNNNNNNNKNAAWTRVSLLSLVRADSFIKETLRLHPFGGRGLVHEVLAPEGVALPGATGDAGVVAPRGAWLAVPVSAVQRDEEVYGADAAEFRPWRFVAPAGAVASPSSSSSSSSSSADEETGSAGEGEGGGKDEGLAVKGGGMTAASDTFLAFSRGRHVCPGRFLAANVMKLFLAHVALEYDIKPLEKRPENMPVSDFSVPEEKAEIEVRRRKAEDGGELVR